MGRDRTLSLRQTSKEGGKPSRAILNDEGDRIQLAVVRNKKQLIAAMRMVVNCPVDLKIIMKHKNGPDTEMLIYGAPISRSVNDLESMYRQVLWNCPPNLNIGKHGTSPTMQRAYDHNKLIRAAIKRIRKIPATELFN